MKVTLISYTKDAEDLLILTKSTRLEMTPGLLGKIKSMTPAEKSAELDYMANTIPSSWEFVDYVFMVEGVSRAYTHQQVRTRTGSYAQQTMRILDLSKGFDYVYTDGNESDPAAMAIIDLCMENVQKTYKRLIEMGQAAEDARGVLPTNIATNIVCKFNLRSFADLVKKRSGGRTQGEYRAVVNAMVDEVLKVHPWAEKFLFQQGRDYFAEIEAFASREWPDDFAKRSELLKIVDKMRQEQK